MSGLRGDADASGDRRVTLSEVYQYAYQKTVLETADTRAGVQHPTYGFDLQGSGQLVLTQLAGGTSGLVLGAALEGRFLVLDRARGELVAELGKNGLGERRIALAEGRYLVKRRLGARLEIADLRVERDRYAELTGSSFRAAAVDDEVSKGLLFDPESPPSRWSVGARFGAQYFLEPTTRRTLFPALWRAGVGATLDGVFGGSLGVDALFGQLGGQELSLGALSLRPETRASTSRTFYKMKGHAPSNRAGRGPRAGLQPERVGDVYSRASAGGKGVRPASGVRPNFGRPANSGRITHEP